MNENVENKIRSKCNLECGHDYSEGYSYTINSDNRIWLCNTCNKNLRLKIMKQLILEMEND